MTSVRVALSESSYDIEIGAGLLARLAPFVSKRTGPFSRIVIITDAHVERLYGSSVLESCRSYNLRAELVSVPAGESSKSVAMAEHLWGKLLELAADRKTVIAALGGGVVGDLAGFAAATYARGLPFVQCPTTLLAQVDSSVGGKVGINLPCAKNMVGAFWQPMGVLIDTDVLRTLDERNYRAGLAEVVKYGVILDEDFFRYLEQHVEAIRSRDAQVLTDVIGRCCRLKADVVEADEREVTGQRAVLNYGHTFCHAIEAVTGYGEFLHGEAVAIGMVCASRLAESLGRIDSSVTQRQIALLEALGLPTAMPPLDVPSLLSAMQRDKKSEQGQLRFILPTRLGHVETVQVDAREQVAAVLTG